MSGRVLDRTRFWDRPPEPFDLLGAGVDDATRVGYGLYALDCWTPRSRSHLLKRRLLGRPTSGALLRFETAIPSGSSGIMPFTIHTDNDTANVRHLIRKFGAADTDAAQEWKLQSFRGSSP